MLKDFVLQGDALRIRNNHRPNLAGVARPHPHNDGLLVAVLVSDTALGVHVLRTATDVGFVYLYLILRRAADLAAALPSLHDLTNPLEHEPRRLLGDADGTGHLVGTDSVL